VTYAEIRVRLWRRRGCRCHRGKRILITGKEDREGHLWILYRWRNDSDTGWEPNVWAQALWWWHEYFEELTPDSV